MRYLAAPSCKLLIDMSSLSVSTVRPGSLDAWAVAMRPRTLWVAIVPVLVGTAFAWLDRAQVNWSVFALALLGSLQMQIITNLQNDVGYTARGLDSAARIGMPRATSSGLLSPQQVRTAIWLMIGFAIITGLPLVQRGGWPVLAMGVSSILAALAYMGGPKPIAYTPLGELMVFLFFGLVAVAGSGYVQIGTVTPATWVAASGIGLIAAAVLAVNNHRDIAHDERTGRNTFAVRFGDKRSISFYTWLVLGAFALLPLTAILAGRLALMLPMIAAPIAWRLTRTLQSAETGPVMSALLLRTVKLEIAYGTLMTVGALLAGLG
jgi:1,4-dihydroxy-2-naphthoate polyprenyltransferase